MSAVSNDTEAETSTASIDTGPSTASTKPVVPMESITEPIDLVSVGQVLKPSWSIPAWGIFLGYIVS